jgi:hypothetical protein
VLSTPEAVSQPASAWVVGAGHAWGCRGCCPRGTTTTRPTPRLFITPRRSPSCTPCPGPLWGAAAATG